MIAPCHLMIHGFLTLSFVLLGAPMPRLGAFGSYHPIQYSAARQKRPKKWVFHMANLGDNLGGYWVTTKELATKITTYLLQIKFTMYERNWDCQVPISYYQTWRLKPKPSSDQLVSAPGKLAMLLDVPLFFNPFMYCRVSMSSPCRCLRKLLLHSIFSSQAKTVSLL